MAKVGDRVEVICKDHRSIGTFMPSQKDSLVVIKLDSGYNKAVLKDKVKEIKVLEPYTPMASKIQPAKQKAGLPVISILHTGGTIASKVDYRTGGVIARFTPEELIELFPELEDLCDIRSRLVSNMWSEDMRFDHYNVLAEAITEEIKKGAKGIIITHGTDTLHYTSAALSFMFESLPVPVILVGAQRSSDRGSSDAGMNLISAARFIVNSDFAQVAICMHAASDDSVCHILPGTKARKMHASRRDAFKAINAQPIAEVDFDSGEIRFFAKDYRRAANIAPSWKPMKGSLRIAILKAHPNMFAQELDAYKGFDGIILEGFGIAGHLPINEIDDKTSEHKMIASSLAKLCRSGVVFATSQTIFGRMNQNVYSTGRDMSAMGVLGDGCDMHPETAFIKLAYLLSNYSKEDAMRMMSQDLRGELSDRSGADD